MNRESLLSVLMYVFENYYEQDQEVDADSKEITDDMLKAGFERRDIDKALTWFKELNEIRTIFMRDYPQLKANLTRVYTSYEIEKINVTARGYLFFLEQAGIIDPVSREVILDRVMALDEPVIDMPELKWVCLMVLFSQSDKQDQLRLMEDLIFFNDDEAVSH